MRYKRIYIDGKRVYEHRYIMEQILGRKLSPKEAVHHINGNKLDNRPKNLKLMSLSEHQSLEASNMSEETRAKIGQTHTGMKRPKSAIEKLRKRMMGNTYWVGKKHKPETIAKISAAQKGKPRPKPSKETRAKMSQAQKARWARVREENKSP